MSSYQPFEEVVKPVEVLTLAKYCKEKGDNVPPRSIVKVALFPNKFANYTFVTEHNFKVLVYEDNPLYARLEDFLVRLHDNQEALFIRVVDTKKAWWQFEIDTDESATWEKNDYGYKSTITPKKNTSKKKASTSKSVEQGN